MDFEYGMKYKGLNMEGEIHIGNGILKVQDITKDFPEFMKEADCVFVDFPGGQSPLNSYYTKANIDYRIEFGEFLEIAFKRIKEINPKYLFVETFKRNHSAVLEEVKKIYPCVKVYNSTYYHRGDYKCFIIQGTYEEMDIGIEGMDEEDAVPVICEKVPFECIGDICMGQGLVGRSAYKNHKRFVGTELNYKRLAVLVDWLVKEGEHIE